MNKQHGFVWAPVLIIVAVIAVAGVAGYLLIQATTNTSESENANVAIVNTPVNENTNAALNTNGAVNVNSNVNAAANNNTNTTANVNTNTATDPTAGWETYTNSTVGYTVIYPTTWNASLVDQLGGYDSFTSPEVYAQDSIAPGSPLYLVNIFPFIDDPATLNLTNTTDVTINNVQGVRGRLEGIPHETNVVLQQGSKGVRIAWPESRTNELVEQIISSFRFTD